MARPKLHTVSVTSVEYVGLELAKELMTWGEPIPPFNTRFPSVLESCLRTPFQTYQRKSLYAGLIKKASILFYLLIKNHPFQNGNKRVAVMTLLYFLRINGRWIYVPRNTLYELAKSVAESEPKDREAVMTNIENFLIKEVVKENVGL